MKFFAPPIRLDGIRMCSSTVDRVWREHRKHRVCCCEECFILHTTTDVQQEKTNNEDMMDKEMGRYLQFHLYLNDAG